MLTSNSDSKLDHSIFKNDHRYTGGSPTQSNRSGGGGGIVGASSSAASTAAEDEEDAPNAQEPVVEEEETSEPLINLISAKFIDPDSATIDQDIEVEAEYEYLTERTPALTLQLIATYNGTIERGPNVEATITDGLASGTLTIAQHMDFYFNENRAEDDKIEYSFNVTCSEDNSELQGDTFLLPGKPLSIDIIEVADSLFNSNSAVPLLDEDGLLMASITKAFEHAQEWPDKEIVIYGHTDTSGENSLNYTLSEKRAQAFKALLSNDSETYKTAISDNSTLLDCQTMLNTLSSQYGWACYCGIADGVNGPNTEAGILEFQKKYNGDTSQSISEDGILGPQTWGAIADSIYQIALNEQESTGTALNFGTETDGLYPCGESFPVDEALKDSYNSSTNRRCEIGFHERPNPPGLVLHTDPNTLVTHEECPVYDLSNTSITVIPSSGNSSGTGECVEVNLADSEGNPSAHEHFILISASGESIEGTTDENGYAHVEPGFDGPFLIITPESEGKSTAAQ